MLASKFLVASSIVDVATAGALLYHQTLRADQFPHQLNGTDDQTSVTETINDAIKVGCYGCYNGGKGILVRNPFDGYETEDKWQVVPATFLTNDIVAATTVFPTGWGGWEKGNGNPDCPNPKSNGFKPMPECPKDPRTGEDGPWNYATTAYVIASSMDKFFTEFDKIQTDDWGWGVFYPSDGNSVDGRCRWLPQFNGYDCPGGWIPWGGTFQADTSKRGTGSYPPGNPFADKSLGGGTGCHIGLGGTMIDQTPVDAPATPLVQDQHCQCNYLFRDEWSHWVQVWIAHAHNYRKEDGWFGGGKAPGHALDQAACWVNNPKDMIKIQNALWFNRYHWANQISPASKWNNDDPKSLRPYWGWNEVPISRAAARNELLRDAMMIQLPAAICGGDGGTDSLTCLGQGQQQNLEGDLNLWVQNNILLVGAQYIGKRPGSYVVLARQWMHSITGWSGKDNWSRWFYCENWKSPSGHYEIVFIPKSQSNPTGACYLEKGGQFVSEISV